MWLVLQKPEIGHYESHAVYDVCQYAISSIQHWKIFYTFSVFPEKQQD